MSEFVNKILSATALRQVRKEQAQDIEERRDRFYKMFDKESEELRDEFSDFLDLWVADVFKDRAWEINRDVEVALHLDDQPRAKTFKFNWLARSEHLPQTFPSDFEPPDVDGVRAVSMMVFQVDPSVKVRDNGETFYHYRIKRWLDLGGYSIHSNSNFYAMLYQPSSDVSRIYIGSDLYEHDRHNEFRHLMNILGLDASRNLDERRVHMASGDEGTFSETEYENYRLDFVDKILLKDEVYFEKRRFRKSKERTRPNRYETRSSAFLPDLGKEIQQQVTEKLDEHLLAHPYLQDFLAAANKG